eukprot:CAMPEP_0181471676 /NCGR_PEP_ID=MMETSP1110-20121109/39199_1 /TAXON_ID=174948 /ORGANISM="Symbiodinium sp., Strain CCMP421" /LENGTH=44 /DNA_ID= /DNA_START= /DNA_END= /DNA_ORIENTATION=
MAPVAPARGARGARGARTSAASAADFLKRVHVCELPSTIAAGTG